MARRGGIEVEVEGEVLRFAEEVAVEAEAERVVVAVLAQQDQFIAVEEIGNGRRHEFAHALRVGVAGVVKDGEIDIGQHGAVETPEDAGDLEFDVFAGQDVGAGGAAHLGDAVEERSVDVGADAEGEDAAVVGVAGGDHLADGGFGGLADGGQAVGEEKDDGEHSLGGRLAEGFDEGVVNVGSAPGFDHVEVDPGGGGVLAVLDDGAGRVGGDVGRVVDDVEGLAVVESLDDLQRGGLGLIHLLAGHAAGAVEDDGDFAENRALRIVDADGEAGDQQEVTPADFGIGIGKERSADAGLIFEEDGEAEWPGAVAFELISEGEIELLLALADHGDFVAGGVDRRDRRGCIDDHADRPRAGGGQGFAAGQEVVDAAALAGEDLVVGEADALTAVGLDGEDAGADEAVAGELEEGGIADLVDDGLVDAAGLIAGEDFGGGFRGSAFEHEVADDGSLGNGQEENRLLHAAGAVLHGDLEGGRCGLTPKDNAGIHTGDDDGGLMLAEGEAPDLRHDDGGGVAQLLHPGALLSRGG